MARQRFIYDANTGRLAAAAARAPRPRVHIVGDHHEPFQSMADGRTYDSKSAYRRELRARGYEEVGNERAEFNPCPPAPSDATPDLMQAASQLGISF